MSGGGDGKRWKYDYVRIGGGSVLGFGAEELGAIVIGKGYSVSRDVNVLAAHREVDDTMECGLRKACLEAPVILSMVLRGRFVQLDRGVKPAIVAGRVSSALCAAWTPRWNHRLPVWRPGKYLAGDEPPQGEFNTRSVLVQAAYSNAWGYFAPPCHNTSL